MGVFSKVFKGKDASSSSSHSRAARDGPLPALETKPTWADGWARKQVGADEVQELLHVCTQELKSRALDMPFVLLPFRPDSDSNGARTFIRNFFSSHSGTSNQYQGNSLYQELRIIEPMVLCSIMKWCWSRLDGGVVGWNTYELFRQGEKESQMAKHSFDTFIPLSVESDARKRIIFDFFELLAAIAANGKTNGLGGRKLSRLAGWWAFNYPENGKGFDAGYRSWAQAADASSHLFFAYLRSLAPETAIDSTVSKLPRSLQALLAQTEYPPVTPRVLLSHTSKVVMLVNNVSPSPFALLRRARNFDYRSSDRALVAFSEYDDPLSILTGECQRVLEAISASNSTSRPLPDLSVTSPSTQGDASWSRFEDLGFSSLLDGPLTNGEPSRPSRNLPGRVDGIRSSGASAVQAGRPTTPSWAEFLSSGFTDESEIGSPSPFLMSPDQQLPPLAISRVQSSQSHVKAIREENLEPGELASIARIDVDETFWWVWISSLATEEPPERKAVFGRCAFIETDIHGAQWLVLEEQVKNAASTPTRGAIMVEKKKRFSSLTSRRTRRSSTGRTPPVPKNPYQNNGTGMPESRTTIGPDQAAKIQAAALALVQKKHSTAQEGEEIARKRGRTNDQDETKTQSVMTLGLQPVIMKEAGPAMQWARKFDKEAVREQYLGDNLAGRGLGPESRSPNASSTNLPTSLSAGEATRLAQSKEAGERELPPTPAVPEPPAKDEPSSQFTPAGSQYTPASSQHTPAPASSMEDAPLPPEPIVQVPKPSTPRNADAQVSPEGENTLVNNTPDRQILRKPVNSVDLIDQQHPALREELKSPAKPEPNAVKAEQPPANQSPAVVAATLASRKSESANLSPSSPEATSPQKATRKASTRGFRSMFNKRKTQAPETVAAQRAYNATSPESAATNASPVVAKTSSNSTRNSDTSPVAAPAPPVIASEALPTQQTDAIVPGSIDDGEPGPEMTADTDEETHFDPHKSNGTIHTPAPEFAQTSDHVVDHAEETSVPVLDDRALIEPEESMSSLPTAPQEASPTSALSNHQSVYQSKLAEFSTDSAPMATANETSKPGSAGSGYQTRIAALLDPAQQQSSHSTPEAPAQTELEQPTLATASETDETLAVPSAAVPEHTPLEPTSSTGALEETKTSVDQEHANASLEPVASTEQVTALPEIPKQAPPAPPSGQAPLVPKSTGPNSLARQPAPAPVESAKDRWAQIRKNAANRRTAENTDGSRGDSFDQKSLSGGAESAKPDEEPNGEDSKLIANSIKKTGRSEANLKQSSHVLRASKHGLPN